MIDALHKLTESMRAKVQLMVGRAILSAINDGGAVQTVQAQLMADEVQDDAERIQQYGFTSVPLPGAEAVLVFVGGNRDHGLVIATEDRRYRKTGLQPGEVCLYTDEGDSIIFNRGKIVRITAGAEVDITAPVVNVNAGTQAQVTSPLVTVTASTKVRLVTPALEVTGDIKDNCDSGGKTMAAMRTAYNGHSHTDPQGGSVGPATPSM